MKNQKLCLSPFCCSGGSLLKYEIIAYLCSLIFTETKVLEKKDSDGKMTCIYFQL